MIDPTLNENFAFSRLLFKTLNIPRNTYSSEFLLHPSNKMFRNTGIWNVTLSNKAYPDPGHWTVINWDMLSRQLLLSKEAYLALMAQGIEPRDIPSQDISQLLSSIYIEKIKKPGSEFRREDRPFLNLISFMPERIKLMNLLGQCSAQVRNSIH